MESLQNQRKNFSRSPFRNLRTMMMRWIKGVFSSFDEDDYRFVEGSPDSKIAIYGAVPAHPDANEARPCIVYQRLPSGWHNPGYGAGPLVQTARLGHGLQRKTSLISGAVAFHCCSKTADEAEDIAWVVSFWLRECLPMLTRLGFFNLGEPSINPVTPAPDAILEIANTEWTVCTVSFPFSFQYSWDSNAMSRTLKMTEMALNADSLSQEIEVKE